MTLATYRRAGHRARLPLTLLLLAACGTPSQTVPRAGPETPSVEYRSVGVASWYGPGFHGKITANGERYDMDAMTAAHRSLPFGTRVQVTNLENGRSAVFRINDRGPFVDGRIIDLSRHGAEHLNFLPAGIARVRVEALASVSRTPPPAEAPQPAAYELALAAALRQPTLQPTPWQDPAAGTHGVIVPLTTPVRREGLVCRNYRRTAINGETATIFVGRACRNGRNDWEITRERRAS